MRVADAAADFTDGRRAGCVKNASESECTPRETTSHSTRDSGTSATTRRRRTARS